MSRSSCRDCADYNGVCPLDGSFCSLDVEKRHAVLLKAAKRQTLRTLANACKHVLTAASVECLITSLETGLIYDKARGKKKQ